MPTISCERHCHRPILMIWQWTCRFRFVYGSSGPSGVGPPSWAPNSEQSLAGRVPDGSPLEMSPWFPSWQCAVGPDYRQNDGWGRSRPRHQPQGARQLGAHPTRASSQGSGSWSAERVRGVWAQSSQEREQRAQDRARVPPQGSPGFNWSEKRRGPVGLPRLHLTLVVHVMPRRRSWRGARIQQAWACRAELYGIGCCRCVWWFFGNEWG